MRKIDYIVLHCTASPQSQTVESIKQYWKKVLGWKKPGYHYIIRPDGIAINLLPIEEVSNGVAGFNSNSIHISNIGGVDAKGNPVDNRTSGQIITTIELLTVFKKKFPSAKIKGHNEFPGVKKACPSFSVPVWLKEIGF
ncbi:MAG: N-acetylmuramoyl-L-alanine amidase [Sphingobacteriaceae bacterium]|nr:N-acetylmuramoyl-L-alanine amidase [Sphingobacteriaceae bacterium]